MMHPEFQRSSPGLTCPAAIAKLIANGRDHTKLTVAQPQAIALVHFMKEIPKGSKDKKADIVKKFEELTVQYPDVIPRACNEHRHGDDNDDESVNDDALAEQAHSSVPSTGQHIIQLAHLAQEAISCLDYLNANSE